jgi:hypothetical protein
MTRTKDNSHNQKIVHIQYFSHPGNFTLSTYLEVFLNDNRYVKLYHG